MFPRSLFQRNFLTWRTAARVAVGLACVYSVTVTALGVGIYLCLPRSPRFTEEQYERIQVGMTQPEVEAVLGCPPGDYAQEKLLDSFEKDRLRDRWRPQGEQLRDWLADTPEPTFTDEQGRRKQHALGISVWFDQDGRVAGKESSTYTYTPPTLLERLRAWVGW